MAFHGCQVFAVQGNERGQSTECWIGCMRQFRQHQCIKMQILTNDFPIENEHNKINVISTQTLEQKKNVFFFLIFVWLC